MVLVHVFGRVILILDVVVFSILKQKIFKETFNERRDRVKT